MIYSFTLNSFRGVGVYCFNSRYLRIFLNLLFLLISNLSPLSLETYFVWDFYFLKFIETFYFFSPASADLSWWIFHMLWKEMYTVKLLDVVIIQILIYSIWLIMSLKLSYPNNCLSTNFTKHWKRGVKSPKLYMVLHVHLFCQDFISYFSISVIR